MRNKLISITQTSKLLKRGKFFFEIVLCTFQGASTWHITILTISTYRTHEPRTHWFSKGKWFQVYHNAHKELFTGDIMHSLQFQLLLVMYAITKFMTYTSIELKKLAVAGVLLKK